MSIEQTDSEMDGALGQESERKKVYKPPRLTEWGSITDLTLGGKFGEEDFDFSGTQGT